MSSMSDAAPHLDPRRHRRRRFRRLCAAKALKNVPVDVTLIDRTNHYLFQPLLYQVATGVLSPADIAMPIRFLVRDSATPRC
jgi:NADH dehydrogenase